MNVVVIGAGFAGACAARRLRDEVGADVMVLERASVPGGMLRTHATADGVPYEYGPRVVSVFRGSPAALPFVRRFVELAPRRIYQGTRLRPDFPIIPFPVDRASLLQLPCGDRIAAELAERQGTVVDTDGTLRDYLESAVGPTLTELAFAGFNLKFWGRKLEDMPAEWGRLRRLERVAETGDWRLPSDAPHHYPVGGFNPLFEGMLEDLPVRYGVRALAVEVVDGRPVVRTSAGDVTADLVVSTAPIDELLGHRFGSLGWRGYRIDAQVADGDLGRERLGRAPDGTPFAWVYTPWPEESVTRTTDFGVIHHGHDAPDQEPSVILRERVDNRVRMYPVWWEDDVFYRYLAEAAAVPGLVPIGRLGLYKYVTIDSTYSMVERFLAELDTLAGDDAVARLDALRAVRGDWSE